MENKHFRLVVAKCGEDTKWAEVLARQPYRRGVTLDKLATESRLGGIHTQVLACENVGREADSYLRYIVGWWDSFSDYNIFTQGDPLPHLYDFPFERFFTTDFGFLCPYLATLKEWNERDGTLTHYGSAAEACKNGTMRRAKLSFSAWWQEYLGEPLPVEGIAYMPGAIFRVSKELIQRRSKAFYEKLLSCVNDHVHPEEAYYLERAWLYVFAPKDGEMGVTGIYAPSEKGPGLYPVANELIKEQQSSK